jgi:hypothetical protein
MVFMVSIRGTARGDISLIYYRGFYGFYFPPPLFPPRPLAAARACAADHNFPLTFTSRDRKMIECRYGEYVVRDL